MLHLQVAYYYNKLDVIICRGMEEAQCDDNEIAYFNV